MFNAPFNNISVTSWWEVLLLEERGSDCIGSYISNYHAITITMTPVIK
jgi:hypothetical protein